MNFVLSAEADNDLVDLWYHIASVSKNPETADSYIDSFEEEFKRIASFPFIGESRDYLVKGFRKWSHKGYIIYYTVAENNIRIERIIWGRKGRQLL